MQSAHKKNPNNPTFCSSLLAQRLHFQELDTGSIPMSHKRPIDKEQRSSESTNPMFPPIKKQTQTVYDYSRCKQTEAQLIQKKKENSSGSSKMLKPIEIPPIQKVASVHTYEKPKEKKTGNQYVESFKIYNRYKHTQNFSPIPQITKLGFANQKQILRDIQAHNVQSINPLIGKYLKNMHEIAF